MGYLDAYGAGEERRNRIIKRLLIAALIVVVIGIGLWFRFRNWAEDQQVSRFLELLRGKDYKTAYSLWGCTFDRPCRDYSFEKFMEDWGPQSPHADAAAMQVTDTKSCSSGVIKFVKSPQDVVQLWVDRRTRQIGFAPWPVCNPRMQVDPAAQAR